MHEFVAADDPLSAAWSPGAFRYELAITAVDATERIRAASVAFDALGRERRTAAYVSWIQPGRIRLWRQSFWRRRPLSGALLFDGVLEDGGAGTVLSGRLRLGPAYIATAAWTLVYLAIAAVLRAPWLLVLALPAAALVQVLFIAIASGRDVEPLLDFVDKVLEQPGDGGR